MSGVDKRGEMVALFSGVLSIVAAVLLYILAMWSASSAVWAAAFQMTGVAGIWLLSLMQLHQVRLVGEEQLEIADLERVRREKLGGAKTVFEEDDLDQMEKLAMGRRLRTIERFVGPVIALVIAAFHVLAGLAVLPWSGQWGPVREALEAGVQNATVMVFFMLGLAFVSFMVSRYALGMARLREYALLRAGGNFMFGASVVGMAVMVGMLFVMNGMPQVEHWIARGIGILLIVLAAETALNFIMDFYRPRIEGEVQRPFYDSRLLGMFSEPGGILQSLAKAIDYQFGFKVSETWFYKLLGRQLPKLLLVQAAVIWALTTFTVVPPGHEAVIEHFPLTGEAGEPTIVKPGIHVTRPWPIDRAWVVPTERIQRLEIGFEPHPQDAEPRRGAPVLWTKPHYVKEYKLIAAGKSASDDKTSQINLLNLNMPIHWRVRPNETLRFYRQSANAGAVIESLAYRELTQYAARTNADDLLGAGGVGAAAELKDRLQAACDAAGQDGKGLGVEIVHVGIGGIHPPPEEDVAKTYEEVINAYEKRAAAISKGEGEAAMMQINSAGMEYLALYEAILEEDKAREAGSPELPKLTAKVEEMLRKQAGGTAKERTAQAEQSAFTKVFAERAAAERYEAQLKAFLESPGTYITRAYLELMEVGLKDARKFVIAVEEIDRVLLQMDMAAPSKIDLMSADVKALESRNPQE